MHKHSSGRWRPQARAVAQPSATTTATAESDHADGVQQAAGARHSGATTTPHDAPLAHLLAGSGVLALIAALAILCAWLLPGSLGHDPWKQDETYTFGIVQHMIETGDLIVPSNAGQPFVEKPPIYDWVAAAFGWTLERYLPLHAAARLASVLFSALALYCTARLARRASGATQWRDPRVLGALALFAGTLVVIKHSHDMMTDVALMAGAALGFCGLFEMVLLHVGAARDVPLASHERRDARGAALVFGAGVGISLLAKGMFVPLVFGATTCVAIALYPACRSGRFARSLGTAAFMCAPFALIWPICFYLRSPPLFKVWLWDNNVGRFLGFSVPQLGSSNDGWLFVARCALTVGFPIVPLALFGLVSLLARRSDAQHPSREWLDPRIALPTIFAGVGFGVLQLSATARELYILPFMAPLALVAARGIEALPQRLHDGWDMTSRVLFGSSATLAWIVWSIMTRPRDEHASLHLLGRWLPLDWMMPIQPVMIGAALALTVGWLWLTPALRHTGKWRGIFSWTLGAIVAWGLVSTLLLPWLDYAKSYRSVFENLGTRLDAQWNDGDCMASSGLGESEAPMLYYYTGIEHQPAADPDNTECTWLIVQGRRDAAPAPSGEWHLFWSGARPGDDRELLRVFVRTPRNTAAYN